MGVSQVLLSWALNKGLQVEQLGHTPATILGASVVCSSTQTDTMLALLAMYLHKLEVVDFGVCEC